METKKGELSEEERKILDLIESNPNEYFNVKDIAEKLGISQPTAGKRAEILHRLGFIQVIVVGNNKLCRSIRENKNGQ